MTIPREAQLATLGPWPRGANNIANESDVPNNAFRRGVNVDILPGGKIRRRSGSVLVRAISGGANRGWSDGRTALFRSGGALYRFIPDAEPLQLSMALDPESDMVYGSVNQFIYVSDGKRAWLFNPITNQLRPWGVSSPAGQPTLVATTSGGLFAGRYQVAITYVTADGEESGTGRAEYVDVPEGGGITLTAIPQSIEPHVSAINVYMTRVNGQTLLLYGQIAADAASCQIFRQSLGRPLKTQHLRTLPPAQSGFAFVNGRVFIARENGVLWSESLRFGLYSPQRNFAFYPYEVDMLVASAPGAQAGGCFTASGDKTYFLGGTTPGDFSSIIKHHAGAIRGTQTFVPGTAFKDQTIPDQEVPVWASTAGSMCVGLPDGSVKPLSDGRYAMQVGARGASVFRELQGVRHILTTIEPPTYKLSVEASDSLDILVIKNGVIQ